VTLAVGVGLGLFAGQWLDGLFHSGIVLTLVGAFVGLVTGITSTISLYRATLRKSALEWREEENAAAQGAQASQRRNL
jgi:Putative F0F1-ATPase subunit Ca2+/Mg2+ transporter